MRFQPQAGRTAAESRPFPEAVLERLAFGCLTDVPSEEMADLRMETA